MKEGRRQMVSAMENNKLFFLENFGGTEGSFLLSAKILADINVIK